MYSKMRDFLNCQGIKYLAPAKAGEDAERMVEYRELGKKLGRNSPTWSAIFRSSFRI